MPPTETLDVTPLQETVVVEEETKTAPVQEEIDPFAVDESAFVSLAPEQRAAVDPVLAKWKETAKAALEKERKSFEPHVQKSKALEKLVGDPRFIKWYQEQQAATKTSAQPQGKSPEQVASPEEWANALQAMANGDPAQWTALNQKMFTAWGQPIAQDMQQRMNYIQQNAEMTKMLSEHPDAKELDQIGRENDPTNPSLLELALYNVVERNKGTIEQAYQVARNVAQAMENKGKRVALGMVKEKKDSMTEKSMPSGKDEGIVYVDSIEEAMSANIEAAMDGRKVKYAVKK